MRGRLAVLALISVLLVAPAQSQEAKVAKDLRGQPVQLYGERRQALLEAHSDGITVLFGAVGEDFGEYERFRQRNDFQYLTGLERPGSALILIPSAVSADERAHAIAFVPDRDPLDERWHGPTVGPGQETAELHGLDEVLPRDQLFRRLLEELAVTGPGRGVPKIYTHRIRGSEPSTARASQLIEALRVVAPGNPIEDVRPAMARLRLIKSDSEIELLKRAIAITNEGQRDAARVIRPGAFEYEAQGALEYAFTRLGAERPGFYSIVGSGPFSCSPHYSANRRKMEEGDLVVIDVGAEFQYYTADITRTYPVSGRFSPRQREVYQLVLDAQRAAEKVFVPGESTMRDLQRAAIQAMKDSALRDAEGKSLERYFIHGLGHWLGMDVHDVGDLSEAIPPGAVFTIEPGIYIAEENLGVRIEDDYLATKSGLIKLSQELVSEPDEVEALMKPVAAVSGD